MHGGFFYYFDLFGSRTEKGFAATLFSFSVEVFFAAWQLQGLFN